MKVSRIALATLAALTLSSQAQALELTVKGKITPPACHAEMDGGGVLTWEPIAHKDLEANDFHKLERKDATLKITCDNETQASFAVQTEKSDDTAIVGGGGQHAADRIFGIGTDPVTNKKLGNFIMLHKAGSYDDVEVTRFGAGSRLQASDIYDQVLWTRGYATKTASEEYTILDQTTAKPASASVFTYTWAIEPALNKKSEITSTQEVPFEGKAILTVRYL